MSKQLTTVRYFPDQFEQWNTFVERSNEGTIFHRLDFLAYHGERFRQQEHHLVWQDGPKIFGLMPMAIFEEDGKRVARSPYGASYGGPLFEKPLSYADSREVVCCLINYFKELGVGACHITLPLSCYYGTYSETFRFALLEHGFQCVNRDIASVACLEPTKSVLEPTTSRANEMARKARKATRAGVTIANRGNLQDFWAVLEKTFQKHQTKPTHTQEQFQWLCDRMGGAVYADVAYLGPQPVAGIGFFVINQRVISSFYLCQDPELQHTQALSSLIYNALVRSQESGFKWFGFGTSSVRMEGRENIFRFKESFGATGLFRETYTWQK
jgi:Acetyltransferase (GNAT) domain